MRPASLPLALLAAALFAAPALAQYDADDDYTAPRNATVDARGARRLEVEGKSGVLRVTGVPGLREVRVRGTARASREGWLSEIRLVARREGDVVVVRADIPDANWNGWDGPNTRALDLMIEVPEGMDARVEDGSGEAELRGLGALEVRDGSGSLEIVDVASAEIDDGSGSVRVSRVRGDVRVSDGSGSIEVAHVRGAVVVDSDGSGGIDVRDVGGDFTVRRDGSGGVDYADVRGSVRVPRR